MKRYILLILTGAAFLFSGCLKSLDKEGIILETIYKGRVIDAKDNPLSGIMVRITNDQVTYNSVSTDKDGLFQIKVDINNIDNSYYMLIGDIKGEHRRGQLRGFGMDVYDYGDIPFVDIKLPTVETCDVTYMTQNSFTIKCHVKSQGKSIVTERGLCWATSIPTIENNKVLSGSGEGEYSCTVTDERIDYSTTTYYARAYAINDIGVSYGDPIEINSSRLDYFSLPAMTYGGYTYRIHPDLGGMTWEQANDACESLVAYGYDDWYLPNKEEMLAVAEKTDVLKTQQYYWISSSQDGSTKYHYYLYYSYGWRDGNTDYLAAYRTIPIRKSK